MKKVIFSCIFFCLISLLFSQNFEGFESGNFYSNDWQFGGSADWTITASNPYDGFFCAQAGDITHNQTTYLYITMETTETGDISFYWRVSSQEDNDRLIFSLDGTEVANISGTVYWELYTLSISPGVHTFKWSYEKNFETNAGLDSGWLDSITFPPTTTYDNDLAAISFTGPGAVYRGNSAVYNLHVKNYGVNPQDNYTLKLIREGGIELDVLNVTETIASEEDIILPLVWIVPPDEPACVTYVYGEIELVGDEDPSNNITDNLSVLVIELGLVEIRVGTGNHQTSWYPLNFAFRNNLSETIYFPTEIPYTGLIHAISYYNNFDNYVGSKQIRIWMGNTAQSTLTNGWIPAGALTEMFNGYINFPSGMNTIMIPFDNPFTYQGSNLVVMANRVWDTQTYSLNDEFFETVETLYYDRTRAVNSNTITINPTNPPTTSYLFSRFPNTSFYMEITGLGVIEGTVYDDVGNSITGAQITITETQISTVSNGAAFYRFGNVLAGSYTLTASCYGHESQSQPAVVVEDNTTYLDFNLVPFGTVEVSGHVVGSDDPETGLEGAFVIMVGDEVYQTATDENGDFILTDVFENNTYYIEISKFGYDVYSEDIYVGNSNHDMGTIILEEVAFPPTNVTAVLNPEETEVTITWNPPPVTGRDFEYYNLYRFLQVNINVPSTWIWIGAELVDTFFVDTEWIILAPQFYQYAVKAVYTNGVESDAAFSNVLEKESGSDSPQNIQNLRTQIVGIYPNPFNPSTIISFKLTAEDTENNTEIIIYNIKGQKIKILGAFPSGSCRIGTREVVWDGIDENGKSQPTGIYLIHLKIDGENIDSKKCLLLK
ncbi:MAG: carboxypeptidase regulatory-like domain-containing protein [Candidatus Cloacimonetes bacterium]|nr:carboxypeptidase regulatory-like domain-containing protein [Candidatus Cloacimonadota bacterium]